ncbi:MAG TPA: DedA family protein [Sedimenticola thiotaurini]|uniref:TVP38/TMEM64 family membrane protein n=1 Tax=Sedimenticola thiotaurini TaxID=1543721 RepID=A0A831RM02_9GAMM|nr:DedA family protein [Sedimenticola thiotaurini]
MSSGSSRQTGVTAGPAHRRHRWLGRLLLGLLLGLGAWLLYLLPYQDLPGWVEALGRGTAALGWYGPLLFALASAGLTGVGVPRLLMTGVAAALFGVVTGLLASLSGTLLGAWLTFLLARWSGHEAGLDRWPGLRRFSGLLASQGIVPVLLIRQLPLSSFFINLLLGLTAVRTRDFLIGSLIGFLPEAVPVALIGAGLVQSDRALMLQYLLLGLVLLLAAGLLLRWLHRHGGRMLPEGEEGGGE